MFHRQQPVHRHVGLFGVGDEDIAILVGEPPGFDLLVQALNADGIDAIGLEAAHDVEQQQRNDPLAIGRAFVHLVATVFGGDGGDVVADHVGEIIHRVQTAPAVEQGDDTFRHLAAVEGLAAAPGDLFQGHRQRRLMMHLADARGATIRHEHGASALVLRQHLGLQREIIADPRCYRIAVAGIPDRRRQDLFEIETAVVPVQLRPGVDGAGDGDRMRALLLDAGDALCQVPINGCRRRRLAGTVEGDDIGGPLWRIKAEIIAADPCRFRFNHTLYGARRDGGVHGVAAGA